MKKHSRAGGKAGKCRPGTGSKPQRVTASENASSPTPSREAEDSHLARELSEAREQQQATSEVLQIISAFGAELDPVFQAILGNATRICEAKYGNLYLLAGGAFQIVASHHASAAIATERLRGPPIAPAPGTGLGRMYTTKAAVRIS